VKTSSVAVKGEVAVFRHAHRLLRGKADDERASNGVVETALAEHAIPGQLATCVGR